jgi:PHD/YefM family antitoxin component YafN of YafNO toxin-antitoxin module
LIKEIFVSCCLKTALLNMIEITPQYIKDTAGKKLVVLSKKQFDILMEELDELEDIKRYDAAKRRKQVFVDADIAFKQIEVKRKKNV